VPVGPIRERSNMSENPSRGKWLDRRISVAPMMDWTHARQARFVFKHLEQPLSVCLLYVSSAEALFRGEFSGGFRRVFR
jgi:hypothetical protein